jgi:hypothetical protein
MEAIGPSRCFLTVREGFRSRTTIRGHNPKVTLNTVLKQMGRFTWRFYVSVALATIVITASIVSSLAWGAIIGATLCTAVGVSQVFPLATASEPV